MEILLLIIFLGIIFFIFLFVLSLVATAVGFGVCLGIILLLGSIIYFAFGWPGIIGTGIVIFLVALWKGYKAFRSDGRKVPKKDSYKEWQELDEELEDYDYLDDITGRDDKPWI